jgi:hypothetical protein
MAHSGTEVSVSEDRNKYIYGVVAAAAAPPSTPGIGGAAVETIVSEGTAAIVSDVPTGELQVGREALMSHAQVLEDALRGGAVLPMRFGVVLPDADSVKQQLLDRHHDALVAQLADLETKVELHLRAVFDEATLMGEIVREYPQIRELRDALRGQDPDATYYERIRLGELVAEAVERKCLAEGNAILLVLEPLALAVQAGTLDNERVALNASFLVERKDMPAFDDAVDKVGRAREGRMRLKYTGPLPAHSFVELSVEE